MIPKRIFPTPQNRSFNIYPSLLSIAKRFWPELEEYPPERQIRGAGEVVTFLFAIPFSLAGLIWLVNITEWGVIWGSILYLLFTGSLMLLFERLRFFLIIEIRESRYGSLDGSLSGLALWSAIFVIGPSAVWLAVLSAIVGFAIGYSNATTKATRWYQLRNLGMNLAGGTLVKLVSTSIYQAVGGTYPIPYLDFRTVIITLMALVADILVLLLLWSGFLAYHTWVQKVFAGAARQTLIARFFLLALGLPYLANPFSILAADLYTQNGFLIYLYFMLGMLMVALLARRLSWTTERTRQQSRILERLEQLGREIINALPGRENLPDILQEHIPTMFPAGSVVIWSFPEQILAKHPDDWNPDLSPIWLWLLGEREAQSFTAKDELPWQGDKTNHNPIVIAPILEVDSGEPFGGIYLELHTLAQPWDKHALTNLIPAMKTLGAQIASAVNQAEVYQQALEFQRVSQELQLAGNIQSSLLPRSFPDLPGWQIAVTLDPAGETSGDFFDIIPLSNGKIGIVIADVMDKGIGPAIYMTLSRTLIRTYATEFDVQPDVVFFATNERILKDTHANLFVTAFYGVLDPETGTMEYSNAGHNPPYLLSTREGGIIESLQGTGLPIGMDADATWNQESVQILPGDSLILYTDGIPEAQNGEGEFFQENSLVTAAKNHLGQPAEAVQKAILDSVYEFIGEAPALDDITLMVLVRDE
jgi:serine phosphatase RsbU (regulator of sigma subunit)